MTALRRRTATAISVSSMHPEALGRALYFLQVLRGKAVIGCHSYITEQTRCFSNWASRQVGRRAGRPFYSQQGATGLQRTPAHQKQPCAGTAWWRVKIRMRLPCRSASVPRCVNKLSTNATLVTTRFKSAQNSSAASSQPQATHTTHTAAATLKFHTQKCRA